MYRRVVSLLLLPCLLLTQSASLGHWHDQGQPPGHDQRPHFHTTVTPTCDHDHPHDGDKLLATESDKRPPLSDHDSDAIYIDAPDALVVERSGVDEETASAVWWNDATTLITGVWDSPSVQAVVCDPRPPDSSPCPLYIRHLALLL